MNPPSLVALFLLALAQILSGCYNNADRELRLVQHAAVAKAKVVVSACDKLIGVKYEYVVSEVKYRGSAPWPDFNCHNTHVGQEFAVFYDPASPGFSTIEEPSALYHRNKGWFVPAWLAVPLIFIGIAIVVSIITLAQSELESSKNKKAPRVDA